MSNKNYIRLMEGVRCVKMLSVYVLASFLLVATYIVLSYLLGSFGAGIKIFKFEIPFLLLMLTLLYFPKIKNKVFKYVLPVVPIFIMYMLFDVFYSFLERALRPSDMQNFNTIFDFSPYMALGGILIILIIPMSLFFLLYQAYKVYGSRVLALSLSVRVALFSVVLFLLTENTALSKYHTASYDAVVWSEKIAIRNNGRFSSFIFYGNQEREQSHVLKNYVNNDVDIHNTLFSGSVVKIQNIHMIVLESFIDPRLLKGTSYNQSPLASDLIPYLVKEKGDFSHVISPVYGGGTSQAEFELLTGIKALAKVGSIEFNVMRGGSTSSFVTQLKKQNYSAIATIGSNSSYFNSNLAYDSLGFDEVFYLEEVNDFETTKGDDFIFDGDLFTYNLNKIKRLKNKSDKPIFNYILGMYGHIPFERNKTLRPDVIKSDNEDDRVQRVSNQFYYRTKVLAKFINDLSSIDPNSIIYVTSDHLPALIKKGNLEYELDKHVNISLFLNNGHQSVDVSGKKYYEIPWLIWDLLSETENKRSYQESEIESFYFKLLSESLVEAKKDEAAL